MTEYDSGSDRRRGTDVAIARMEVKVDQLIQLHENDRQRWIAHDGAGPNSTHAMIEQVVLDIKTRADKIEGAGRMVKWLSGGAIAAAGTAIWAALTGPHK